MPIFFQHHIDEDTRVGIWKIEEPESFFLGTVPLQREVHHPHKRLQHLAGRFLLRYLVPSFPYELIRIADTRKPFLENEEFHFSISHCGDYAAVIVSKSKRVGVDIEIPSPKLDRIREKFLSQRDLDNLSLPDKTPGGDYRLSTIDSGLLTILWSCKEAVFKWYGLGKVDFREHIHIAGFTNEKILCHFMKTDQKLIIDYHQFDQLVLAWIKS